jgi:protoheme IX farnesyltransferase
MTDASITSSDLGATGRASVISEAQFRDFYELLKPRVMRLVVFTGLVGLIAAPAPIHPFVGFVAILCIAIGGGAAGALNMWWDADIDAIMKRTSKRPIPAGKVTLQEARGLGFALSGFSVMMLGLATNWFAAGLLAFTIFFYVVIYTIWLKRITPQNIVIGGAAGAFPPMVGWAAVTGDVSFESFLMFALIFMWTPPHFWALALFTRSDYDNASIPMLTVTHGRKSTRKHILAYTVLLAALAFGMCFTGLGGPVFITTAIILNALFLKGAWTIWQRDERQSEADNFLAERKFFKLSLLYLFVHFGAIVIDCGLAQVGLWGVL